MVLVVKNPPANAGDARDPRQLRSLVWEDPLDEGMATHSSILTWRIPGTEKPGGLQSMGLQKVRHNWRNLAHKSSLFFFSIFLPTYSCVLFSMFICFLSLRIEWTFLWEQKPNLFCLTLYHQNLKEKCCCIAHAPKFTMNKLMNLLILLLKSETTNWTENSVHVMNYGLLHIVVWTIVQFACNRGVPQRKNGVFITQARIVLGTRSDLSSLHARCGL